MTNLENCVGIIILILVMSKNLFIRYDNDYFLCGVDLQGNDRGTMTHPSRMSKEDIASYYGITLGCKGLTFYTIVPEDRLSITEDNISNAKIYIEYILQLKYLKKIWWVWESGKYEDKPNLHLHMLIDFYDSKNFKRDLMCKWSKVFKGSNIDWRTKGGQGWDSRPCNTGQIIEDKISYMDNAQKGSHMNFCDLNLRGYHENL